MAIFEVLETTNQRPQPYEFYTTPLMWNDPYVSARMLEFHLDENVDAASRKPDFIARSVDWIVERFGVGAGTKLIDFGCGPGLYTTRLAERGALVMGVDLSERSLAHARETAAQKGLTIDYVLQNYLDFTTEKRFDLITMIYCDFCVLSPEQRTALLNKFRTLLAPGGAILLDVFTVDWFAGITEQRSYEYAARDGFWSADPYYVFLNRFKYEPEKLFLDKHTIVEKARTRTIYNWLQCFDQATLAAEFQANGLEVVEQYANVAGDTHESGVPEMAVVAQAVEEG